MTCSDEAANVFRNIYSQRVKQQFLHCAKKNSFFTFIASTTILNFLSYVCAFIFLISCSITNNLSDENIHLSTPQAALQTSYISPRERTRVLADLLTKLESLNKAMDLTINLKEESTQRKHQLAGRPPLSCYIEQE